MKKKIYQDEILTDLATCSSARKFYGQRREHLVYAHKRLFLTYLFKNSEIVVNWDLTIIKSIL